LVAMWTMLPRWGREAASAPDYQDWRQSPVLEDAAAASRSSMNLGDVSEPERLIAGRVTANMLPVLKLQPVVGRNFTAAEDAPGGPNVVMLGRSLWQRQFGGRADVLGKTVKLNGIPYEIIGVLPSEVNILGQTDLWVPAALRPDAGRRGDFLRVIGRLKDGVTLEQAQAQLSTLARQLSDQYPNSNKDVGIQVVNLHSDLVRNSRPILISLWASVGFVLLIVVANVANLLLARGSARAKEIAIRVALGAKPARLTRQLLTESVVLALAGGALGVGLAYWVLAAALKFLPWQVPEGVSVQLSGGTLLFALGVTLGAGILFGILPALHAGRGSVFGILKEGGRTSQFGRNNARRVLATAEIALSLLLLAGAGLM
ncbi:MAG TPA: ABC transporter permease, partial [Ramlibacter sp.]|nr:ABC transporter permease [Ramlibacter sp.]